MTPDAAHLQTLHLYYLGARDRAEVVAELVEKRRWPAENAAWQADRADDLCAAVERFAELAGLPVPSLRASLQLTDTEREDAA